jgi:hypothetical protein
MWASRVAHRSPGCLKRAAKRKPSTALSRNPGKVLRVYFKSSAASAACFVEVANHGPHIGTGWLRNGCNAGQIRTHRWTTVRGMRSNYLGLTNKAWCRCVKSADDTQRPSSCRASGHPSRRAAKAAPLRMRVTVFRRDTSHRSDVTALLAFAICFLTLAICCIGNMARHAQQYNPAISPYFTSARPVRSEAVDRRDPFPPLLVGQGSVEVAPLKGETL